MKGPLVALMLGALALCVPATASSAVFLFAGSMSGPQEATPNTSTATGSTLVQFDDVLDTLFVQVEWTGLTGGNPAAAHIHATTAASNTGTVAVAVGFPNFPATLSGFYMHTFNLLDPTIYTSAFLAANGGTAAGAEAGLLFALQNDRSYSNIHNATFPAGEIRGFLHAVPEPGTWTLMIGGFGLMGAMLRRRRLASAPVRPFRLR